MTTIALNKTSIACDLQMTHATGLKFKCKTKIIEVPQYTAENIFQCAKAYVSFCGSADVWPDVVSYYSFPQDYEKPPRIKSIELIMLNDRGEIWHATNLRNWLQLDVDYFALGSGSHLALGAMASGKTPKEAVKEAMKWDPSTGMGVKEYKL